MLPEETRDESWRRYLIGIDEAVERGLLTQDQADRRRRGHEALAARQAAGLPPVNLRYTTTSTEHGLNIHCPDHPDAGMKALVQQSYTRPVSIEVLSSGEVEIEFDAGSAFVQEMETEVTIAYMCGHEFCARSPIMPDQLQSYATAMSVIMGNDAVTDEWGRTPGFLDAPEPEPLSQSIEGTTQEQEAARSLAKAREAVARREALRNDEPVESPLDKVKRAFGG